MSPVESLDKKFVVNAKAEPLEVVIPYEQFLDFIETYGLDLDEEDMAALREAHENIKAKNWDAFLSPEEAKRELGYGA